MLGVERPLSTVRNFCFGSGPGLELHAPNGCCTSFTGYSKFEIAGLEPAKSRHTTLCII